jgi:adenine-specific DNA-methyltransferase
VKLHPIQQLYLAEDLVRRRRADEHRRQVTSQRAARIDPNPHQIAAVVFALSRIPDGGCILADEVGLGKTIEAGLVIAQLLAEGARRVLVVTPKALLGQWKQELAALFAIDAREITRATLDFEAEGVLLATRDLVGTEAGASALERAERFDLCIIDEAHEVFAGIYKRFDATGALRDDSPHARTAGRLSTTLRGNGTPIVLLTATPIQNSLAELWGLVHYIDPTGTLLGDLPTFRQLFCPMDDRQLAEGQEYELQRRITTVVKRTLRRQAQEFMSEPFVGRQARLFEYRMPPEERALYDDVTAYLLEPNLHAFPTKQRKLLLLNVHRQMASSRDAFASSLDRIAQRLRGNRDAQPDDPDLGEDDEANEPMDTEGAPADVSAELTRVERFAERARALPMDSKAQALLRAIRFVMEQAESGKGSGKVVIFTEFLRTQEYVRRLLVESRLVGDRDITLFRGTNDSARALEAHTRWLEEVGKKLDPSSRPSFEIALRMALVHEFETRSRILISTEAGAKGLNLQFCNTVINYDLPWNPQRIEQRIGRAHRYRQRRDVTVINFLAADNEAQRLTFDILSQKLDLFGTVLGATDEVLHRPGVTAPETLASVLGTEVEAQLQHIYDRARTIDEVERELRVLRDAIADKRRDFETAQQRTIDIIQSRFDEKVRDVFARIQSSIPEELAAFDQQVKQVVTSHLDHLGVSYQCSDTEIVVAANDVLPTKLREGVRAATGAPPRGSETMPLHLGHPLVVIAVEGIRTRAKERAFAIEIRAPSGELRGRRGRLRIVRARHRGFETAEQLLPILVLAGDQGPLNLERAHRLVDVIVGDFQLAERSGVTDEQLADALDELLFESTHENSAREQARFERTLEQVERFVTDRIVLLERERALTIQRVAKAEADRASAIGSDQRDRADLVLQRAQTRLEELDAEIARLRAGDDKRYQQWRDHTQQKRFATPEIDHLVEAEVVLV